MFPVNTLRIHQKLLFFIVLRVYRKENGKRVAKLKIILG